MFVDSKDSFYQIDARQFHDPDRRRSRVNHIGLSGPVLLGIAKDQAFGQWFFKHVLAVAAAAEALRGGRLHVVCFCRAGRHRSVAVASLLEQLLAKFTAWTTRLEHLACHDWQWRTCNLCDKCRRPSGDDLFDAVRARQLAEVAFRWAFWRSAVLGARH